MLRYILFIFLIACLIGFVLVYGVPFLTRLKNEYKTSYTKLTKKVNKKRK